MRSGATVSAWHDWSSRCSRHNRDIGGQGQARSSTVTDCPIKECSKDDRGSNLQLNDAVAAMQQPLPR